MSTTNAHIFPSIKAMLLAKGSDKPVADMDIVSVMSIDDRARSAQDTGGNGYGVYLSTV